MTPTLINVLLWHLFGTLAFSVVYLCYLPVQAGSGWAQRIAIAAPLGLVSAMLFYSFMSWLFA